MQNIVANYDMIILLFKVKIIDDKGTTVPINTRGQICVRGYAVFKYYWMGDALTEEAKDTNGWWHTR